MQSVKRERLNADLLKAYRSLFIHRRDQYAFQQRDGSYRRVAGPLTSELLQGHFSGLWTVGAYVLDVRNTCRFAVFDLDTGEGYGWLALLAQGLEQMGIPTLVEASRRGGHLWVFLQEPTPAARVRAWLLPFARKYGVELYPKQDQLMAGGLGSLIRLPLGVHQKSREWYPFLTCSEDGVLVPVGEMVDECCSWAWSSVRRVVVPETVVIETPASRVVQREKRVVKSALPASVGMMVPGRGSIRAWCHAQDIVQVIGRYVRLDDRGVGSCPFKEHHRHGDRHPSFQVFGGNNPHWYCYTWGRAGDVFDFLCLYHGLTQQEAWERLLQGVLS